MINKKHIANLTPNKSTGFTLLELAIVIVIIGLIVGGVLVGRDLIKSAAIRQTVSRIGEIDTAVNTFRLKYNCLAGDCASASSFGLGSNGNGNGQIGSYTYSIISQSETRYYFFRHLIAANVLPELSRSQAYNGQTFYQSPLSGRIDFQLVEAPQIISPLQPSILILAQGIVACTGICTPGGQTGFTATIPPLDAMRIDTMIDDGKPDTGRIRAMGSTAFIDVAMSINMSMTVIGNGAATVGPLNDGVSCVTNAATREYNNLNLDTGICSLSILLKN